MSTRWTRAESRVGRAPNGALANDGSSTATANYQGYATPTDSVDVGARGGAGEVIAFSKYRPVALQSALWVTVSGNQTVTVPFANRFDTAVTFWIVAGPYATTQQTAMTLWQTAQQIYWDERLGVRLQPLEIVDATSNPNAASWSAFSCGTTNAIRPGTYRRLNRRLR